MLTNNVNFVSLTFILMAMLNLLKAFYTCLAKAKHTNHLNKITSYQNFRSSMTHSNKGSHTFEPLRLSSADHGAPWMADAHIKIKEIFYCISPPIKNNAGLKIDTPSIKLFKCTHLKHRTCYSTLRLAFFVYS